MSVRARVSVCVGVFVFVFWVRCGVSGLEGIGAN